MDPTPVGQRLRAWRIVACRREQLALQRRVVERGRDRPSDADHRRPANVFRDRCAADPDRLGEHPGARPTGTLQAQNFSNLPHRQSLGGHRTSPCWFAKGGPCPVQIADNATRFTLSTGWPPSIGIGGRFRSDWVAAFRRNQWPPWLGFRSQIMIGIHIGQETGRELRRLGGRARARWGSTIPDAASQNSWLSGYSSGGHRHGPEHAGVRRQGGGKPDLVFL